MLQITKLQQSKDPHTSTYCLKEEGPWRSRCSAQSPVLTYMSCLCAKSVISLTNSFPIKLWHPPVNFKPSTKGPRESNISWNYKQVRVENVLSEMVGMVKTKAKHITHHQSFKQQNHSVVSANKNPELSLIQFHSAFCLHFPPSVLTLEVDSWGLNCGIITQRKRRCFIILENSVRQLKWIG